MPFPYDGKQFVRYLGYASVINIYSVHLVHSFLDIACWYALRIEEYNLVFYRRYVCLVLFDQLRLKFAASIAIRSCTLISRARCIYGIQFFHKQFSGRSIVQQLPWQTITPVFYFYQFFFWYAIYSLPFVYKPPQYTVMPLYRSLFIGRVRVSIIH